MEQKFEEDHMKNCLILEVAAFNVSQDITQNRSLWRRNVHGGRQANLGDLMGSPVGRTRIFAFRYLYFKMQTIMMMFGHTLIFCVS
jgi:hypothetical protein